MRDASITKWVASERGDSVLEHRSNVAAQMQMLFQVLLGLQLRKIPTFDHKYVIVILTLLL